MIWFSVINVWKKNSKKAATYHPLYKCAVLVQKRVDFDYKRAVSYTEKTLVSAVGE